MELKDLAWLFSAISIVACWLNIKKLRICFVIWCFSNIGFIWLNFKLGFYGQLPLWVAFTIINIYGWYEWGKHENKSSKS